MSEMLDNLRKKLEDPEFIKESQEYFLNLDKIKRTHIERIKKHLSSVSDRDSAILSFLKWEEEFEEFQYTHNHCQTESRIYCALRNFLEETGTNVIDECEGEDFLGKAFVNGLFLFKTYYGQGSFDRVYFHNELIFQST